MQNLHRIISRFSSTSLGSSTTTVRVLADITKTMLSDAINPRGFLAKSGENDGKDEWDKTLAGSFGDATSGDLGWDSMSSWSTGLTKEHFDGEAPPPRLLEEMHRILRLCLYCKRLMIKEFHVASLPCKPDFKVMPKGWDGTIRDLDEVHYEISQKEDEMLYQEFIQRMNFNKKKMAGEVKSHKYSRRRLILFQRVGISRLRKWVREGSEEVVVDGSLSACLMVLADL